VFIKYVSRYYYYMSETFGTAGTKTGWWKKRVCIVMYRYRNIVYLRWVVSGNYVSFFADMESAVVASTEPAVAVAAITATVTTTTAATVVTTASASVLSSANSSSATSSLSGQTSSHCETAVHGRFPECVNAYSGLRAYGNG
jgi:hypothetical protein